MKFRINITSKISKKLKSAKLLLILFAAILPACNALKSESLFQKQSNQAIKYGEYEVKPGDSLYSIAWRFRRDYKELARINKISPPYIIKPGQVISLRSEDGEIPSRNGALAFNTPSDAEKAKANKNSKSYVKSSSKTSSSTKKRTGSSARSTNVKKKTTSAKSNRSTIQKENLPRDNQIRWAWPSRGKILVQFSRSKVGRKGIDIGGSRGDSVKSAASGLVVYSGNSLVGYGNLVIVKHSENFLTAYAHNSRVIVKEGQSVKLGQKIAEIGSTGTDSNRLHFEIRKQGKPVNPLAYLPKR